MRLGRYEQAIPDLDKAIQFDPKRATAYQNRGAAYNSLGQYERALKDLDTALKLDPRCAGAYCNRGVAHDGLKQYDQALLDLSEALRLRPRNPTILLNRAGLYAKLGMLDSAVRDYDEAVRIGGGSLAAYVGMAEAHARLGRRDRAIADYDRAVRLNPSDPSLYVQRGNARRDLDDWDGAIDDFTHALQLDPKDADVLFLRGWSLYVAGRDGSGDARAYIQARGYHDPFTPYMVILGALSARRAGHEADARAVLDEAITNLSPVAWPVPVLRYLRGDTAAPILLDAATDDRQRTEAHAFLGLERHQAGATAEAIPHLREAAEQGVARSAATDLARAVLRQIEGPERAGVDQERLRTSW